MFKIINNNKPSTLHLRTYFNNNNSTYNYNTRHSHSFPTIRYNTSIGNHCSYNYSKLWNNLEGKYKVINNKNLFIKRIKLKIQKE